MLVLGIETSCDETAAAVVRDGRTVLSHVVHSQIEEHAPYGGVVPEVAARRHVELLPGVIDRAVQDAGIAWSDADAVAVTFGPGLASSLLIGVTAAQALGLALDVPLIPVNHLEGHLYSVFLGDGAPGAGHACPMLVLLVTGGNTALVAMDAVGSYRLLGRTLDDAAGEALDKGASLLGLGYPGGPAIEQEAEGGDAQAIRFPRGLEHPHGEARIHGMDRDLCFSFSGVKTSLRYHLDKHPEDREPPRRRQVAASYQAAVLDALMQRVRTALARGTYRSLGVVGGVAKNRLLRSRLDGVAAEFGVPIHLAPLAYCTDNAVMVAGRASVAPAPAGPPVAALDIEPGAVPW